MESCRRVTPLVVDHGVRGPAGPGRSCYLGKRVPGEESRIRYGRSARHLADDDTAVDDRAVCRRSSTSRVHHRRSWLDHASPNVSTRRDLGPWCWCARRPVAESPCWSRTGVAVASSSVAWLSLDADDNDPIRFWRHVAASLDRSNGDESSSLRVDVDRLIRRSSDPPLDEVATVVANRVDDAFDDVVLVLDDYHLIDDGDVHAGVRLLLEHAPEQLRVVVISRADPPLLLARRRARGELTEIRAADLRFSSDEAASFLDGATGGRPCPNRPCRRSPNAPRAGQSGSSSRRCRSTGVTDISTFLSTFSGSHRFVLDYLTEEVLDRQPVPVREFLLSTSILERLSGPLCDAVTGDDDGQELLEACERANLFVVPLDDERRWWRYHHLFAELLRARLDRRRGSSCAIFIDARPAGTRRTGRSSRRSTMPLPQAILRRPCV